MPVKEWIRTQLFDQVPLNITVIDRHFRIVEANRAFEEGYGEWQGRRCYELYKEQSERCLHCAAKQTFRDGQTRVSEERGLVRDGKQHYYVVHMVPLKDQEGNIPFVIEMSTDITSHKLLEQEKLEAERLAAVGQTVASLAHGVKNVLMGLDGGMYIARSGIERGDTQRLIEGWQMLEENVARISSFTREFLEFARGRTPKVSLVDPGAITRKVVALFQDKAELIGIQLGAITDEVPVAALDENGIHTCLANLVSNALDACESSDTPDPRIVVRTHERDGTLVFEVEDNGTGMDYEVKKKVFTNFFTTKGVRKGTGLGLLTTRKIVQEHGGKVWFESDEGRGSTFRLEFPRERLPSPDDGEIMHSRSQHSGRKEGT